MNDSDGGDECRPMSVMRSLTVMIDKARRKAGQVFDEIQCDHEWTSVRMIRFADADNASEVVRCVKCGAASVVE